MGACPGCGSLTLSCDKIGADRRRTAKKQTSADLAAEKPKERIKTGIADFDRVIGGGLVLGSAILFGGEKGVGKSTLLSMICAGVASAKFPVLYAMAEQGNQGLGDIFRRTGAVSEYVEVKTNAVDVYDIARCVEDSGALLFIVDSLQVVTCDDVGGSEGSIAQCDAALNVFTSLCSNNKKPRSAIIVNHLNKGGDFAGSETALHLVDTLLKFEYDVEFDEDGEFLGADKYRVLSIAQKNRNGSPRERARFEMTDEGMLVPASVLLEGVGKRDEDRPRKKSRFDSDGDGDDQPPRPRLYPVK